MMYPRSCSKLVASWKAAHKQSPPGTAGLICLPENKRKPDVSAVNHFKPICIEQFAIRIKLKRKTGKKKSCKSSLNCFNSLASHPLMWCFRGVEAGHAVSVQFNRCKNPCIWSTSNTKPQNHQIWVHAVEVYSINFSSICAHLYLLNI